MVAFVATSEVNMSFKVFGGLGDSTRALTSLSDSLKKKNFNLDVVEPNSLMKL